MKMQFKMIKPCKYVIFKHRLSCSIKKERNIFWFLDSHPPVTDFVTLSNIKTGLKVGLLPSCRPDTFKDMSILASTLLSSIVMGDQMIWSCYIP